MSKNKRIRFGVKNVHAAFMTSESDAKPVYDDPISIPGAKSFSAEANSENFTENADDIDWYTEDVNNGYNITLDFEDTAEADAFLAEALGQDKDEDTGMVTESSSDEAKTFALMGEFTLKGGQPTEAKGKRFCFYNCKASRPTISGETKAGTTITAATNSVSITSLPREYDGRVKSTAVSTDSCYSTWFDAVPDPDASAAG